MLNLQPPQLNQDSWIEFRSRVIRWVVSIRDVSKTGSLRSSEEVADMFINFVLESFLQKELLKRGQQIREEVVEEIKEFNNTNWSYKEGNTKEWIEGYEYCRKQISDALDSLGGTEE